MPAQVVQTLRHAVVAERDAHLLVSPAEEAETGHGMRLLWCLNRRSVVGPDSPVHTAPVDSDELVMVCLQSREDLPTPRAARYDERTEPQVPL